MIQIHKMLDFYRHHANFSGDYQDNYDQFEKAILSAVQFDAGEFDNIPKVGALVLGDETQTRAPYDRVIIQFYFTAPVPHYALVYWRSNDDGSVTIIIMAKVEHDTEWRGTLPIHITRKNDGKFHFESTAFESTTKVSTTKPSSEEVHLMFAACLNFFAIINCSNVEYIEHPAPAKLNRKRQKNGKAPILEYRTLHLSASPRQIYTHSATGVRLPPRVHLRRGHIRRLPSGHCVWVQPCVVGDKSRGVVIKDYAMS